MSLKNSGLQDLLKEGTTHLTGLEAAVIRNIEVRALSLCLLLWRGSRLSCGAIWQIAVGSGDTRVVPSVFACDRPRTKSDWRREVLCVVCALCSRPRTRQACRKLSTIVKTSLGPNGTHVVCWRGL